MRAHNERLLLSLIRRHGSLTKAEIARLTSLSSQTISVIIRKLEEEGLLQRGDLQRGRIGQPSTPMALAADGVLSFGLKIGRRSAEMVLMDFVGNVRDVVQLTYTWPLPAAMVDFARKAAAGMMRRLSHRERNRIAGMGIATPLQLWKWRERVGVTAADMDAWHDADLTALLADEFPFPIFQQKDATAACSAEFVFGRGSEFKNFLYIFIGFFVGGGIVLNGALFPGSSGNAGAIGTLPVTRDDQSAAQLIDTASIFGLEADIKAAGLDPSPLWTEPDGWSKFTPFNDAWIATIAPHLARAILAGCSIIDFEAAIIDGDFPADIRARIVQAVSAAMETFDLEGIAPPAIVEGCVGRQARAVGGACLPLFDRYILSSTPFVNEIE
ncbi:ROK family transcriptional regulator [Methylovirgula sp. 4M-Z18]|uniref:ROK family transcriptional regulator n=1 Tax=Methylovirgula sp. 4M-Z18 TaxID=2293567 RepID=UPI001FE035C5|nr:ROK family transcriptional regulator [Methylovirgula sp. 4M-Z18]